jgi:hypothetical protein
MTVTHYLLAEIDHLFIIMDCTENIVFSRSFIVAFVYLLLQSHELVAMEMCSQRHYLARDVFSASAILAFSRHVVEWR